MKNSWKPWHQVVALRDDLKTGELSLAIFAADLHDVVMQRGKRPVYENPGEFFALTYPTYALRELVKDVALRLAGKSDKAYRRLSVNYGGGKTHTLITLRHLVHDPAALPELPAVQEFRAHVGLDLPRARVAALCFDKIDVEKGVEARAPDGEERMLQHPWSILAWQLAGAEGLKAIHADGKDEERDTSPAEPLLVDLLSRPQQDGLSTLVLLDEVLMYVRAKAEAEPKRRGSLVGFFQHLTQAVVKVDRCAMVASLLASDPGKHDDLGRELLANVSDVFVRQMEEDANPVGKEDVAEVLRRRFFKPESISDSNAFRPQVTTAVGNVATLDEKTRKARAAEEERYLKSYPFHPHLTEVFYSRWTQLDRFQRTRGILRTFAIALRDAEKWDESPLVGANVLLNAPNKGELGEAARALCQVASVETAEGDTQQWDPILQGELEKARVIHSETAGLHGREIEQAVVAVFLSSQPIGQKAQTPELNVLLGATRPDRIELEKALLRWTELSWFLDETETDTGERNPDGAAQLPKAWRLGNRPNLRQMHHDACNNRVPAASLESCLDKAIKNEKRTLTAGASAAGATLHMLPKQPGDIQDDGDFHFAVLGPKAASDSGKPSAVARRFVHETTSADRPRVRRNAIVLAVPSRDGLEAARACVRDYLGWVEVQNQLKGQEIDPVREQMLESDVEASRRRIPDAIRQAWCIVVTVNDANETHAFKITVSARDPLFTTIKADKRARIQETTINSEAMLPDGPYDLWQEGETSRPVKDLVGAFAENPKLPKMLNRKAIQDTVAQGVQAGIWVGQIKRPDKSTRTFWRMPIDDALKDSGLEVFLPEAATLIELAPELLEKGRLPGLWSSDEITASEVIDYFAGGHTVTVPKEGYEETVTIPKCEADAVQAAIAEAVELGMLWFSNGPTSLFREPLPAGVITPEATLSPPPDPIAPADLMEEAIPEAWKDNKTNALAILTALTAQRGKTLPWPLVRDAIGNAINVRWIERVDDSATWPCDFSDAGKVAFQLPAKKPRQGLGEGEGGGYERKGVLMATAPLHANGIQDLAEQIPDLSKAAAGHDLKFHLSVELGGETPPDADTLEKINALLVQVSKDLKLG